MKRRDFIRTTGIAGVSAGIASQTVSCSKDGSTKIKSPVFFTGEIKEKFVLKDLENEFLKLIVFSDASVEILDKRRNTEWKTGPVAMQEEGSLEVGHVWIRKDRSVCEQYPGRFVGEKSGEALKYTMLGRQNEIMGQIVCNYELEKDEIVFRLLNIDEQIPSLVFPPPIISESLILPESQGSWIKKPFSHWNRYVFKLFSHINMRWFGGLKGDNGWMAIFEEGWADSCILGVKLTLSSGWLKSLNKWTPRSMRYCFTDNGYVGMAKRYRKWAMDHGLFKTLKEKVEHLPQLKNMIGGRLLIVYMAYAKRKKENIENQLKPLDEKLEKEIQSPKVFWTFKEAKELFQRFKKNGVKKGVLYLAGWMKDGYDASHPDVWPPEKQLGSIDDFKDVCSESGSYFTMLHDNYQDMYEGYPSFPKGININKRDRLMTGGIWSDRQCYIMNSKNSIEYAKRNWKELKNLGVKGMYIDTTTTMEMFESFEEGNTQTRQQDFDRKCELVKFFYDQNMVFGSEQISEVSVNNASFGNMHGRKLDRVPGERIPLWQLAFHDSCITLTSMRTRRTKENKKRFDKHLEQMLYGCSVGSKLWEDFFTEEEVTDHMINSLHADRWHEQIAFDEMVSHKFLTDDYLVEESEFSSGKKIICNFDDKARKVNGITINAWDYKIM